MTGKEKKMFNDRFNAFIIKLAKLYNLKILTLAEVKEIEAVKNPSTNKHSINKNYYYNLMYARFDKLLSLGLDAGESLNFIFEPLNQILAIQRVSKRRTRPQEKNFLAVINYYLENDISEYKACQYGLREYHEKNKESQKFKQDKYQDRIKSFQETFRKWYNNFDNQLLHPEIFAYKKKLAARKKV